jgi:hypothetical protein
MFAGNIEDGAGHDRALGHSKRFKKKVGGTGTNARSREIFEEGGVEG